MLKLSVEEIIEKISKEELFEAVSIDYSFTLKTQVVVIMSIC